MNTTQVNAAILSEEMNWLGRIIDFRLKNYFGDEHEYQNIYEITPPALDDNSSRYAEIIKKHGINVQERLILLLALAPYLKPNLLDPFFIKNATYDRGFTEFGGVTRPDYNGFLPTGETAAFILCGNDLEQKLSLLHIFSNNHFFSKEGILALKQTGANVPLLSGALQLSTKYAELIISGSEPKPVFNADFPARQINTAYEWEDMVLDTQVLEEITEIKTWIEHSNSLFENPNLRKKIKPGFRSLFYGPSGTGKTLSACLLGKSTGRDVYRVNIAQVVSKYIGETEKNLNNIFKIAEDNKAILFFNEADALVCKAAPGSNSYSRQEIAYIWQKIEDHPGVVILASNITSNMDEAFVRRFQNLIHFPMPGPEERLRLWKDAFADTMQTENKIDFADIANKYELAGGSIMNVVRYAHLAALKRGDKTIIERDIQLGIRRELKQS